jgi:uncharacterized membrane protein
MRRLQIAAVVVLIVAYSVLSHYSNAHAQARDLATALALAPSFLLATALLWRWRGVWMALGGILLLLVCLNYFWPALKANFMVVYLVQQAGFSALMAATFAVTLLKGRTPLCTLLADKVHGPLTAQELIYTRQVTAAWAVFFLLMALANVLLCEYAPFTLWSVFANFISLPLIVLMFLAEAAVRRRVLPQTHSGGIMATLRVYFASPR